MDTYKLALELSSVGWKIFPVIGKKPATPNGMLDATDDEEQIKKWFESGRYGIGLPMKANQLICFDMDYGHTDDSEVHEKLNDWYDKYWNPGYMDRETQSGGLHIICDASRLESRPPSYIMPFLDVRYNAYIVYADPNDNYRYMDGQRDLEMLSPVDKGMLKIVEHKEGLTDSGGLVPVDVAWDNIEKGHHIHESILSIAQHKVNLYPNNPPEEICELIEQAVREIAPDGLKQLDERLEWEDERGELWRAVNGARRMAATDEELAEVWEKLKDAPDLTQEVEKAAVVAPEGGIRFDNWYTKDDLPPRDWMLGKYLLKGKVTTVVAPGGTGKSVLSLVWALSIATGQKLLHPEPNRAGRVLVWSGEDDRTEVRRRLVATAEAYELDHSVVNQLAVETYQTRKLKLVTKQGNETKVQTAAVDRLIEDLKAADIEAFIVDPLISLHGVNENDNGEMEKVMDQLIRIAQEANVAVMVVHHVAKGAMRDDQKGDPADAARGATAIVNRARVALALRPMNEKEAKHEKIDEGKRFLFVQVVDAKANLSERTGYSSEDWVELRTHELGNGTARHPGGDCIGVPVRYEKRPLHMSDIEAYVKVLGRLTTELERGPSAMLRAHSASAGWIGHVVADACGLNWGTSTSRSKMSPQQQLDFDRAEDIIDAMFMHELIVKASLQDAKRMPRECYVPADDAEKRIIMLQNKLGIQP